MIALRVLSCLGPICLARRAPQSPRTALLHTRFPARVESAPGTAAPTKVTHVTSKSGIRRCAFWKGVFNIITCISILTRVSLYFTPQHTVYYQFEFWNMYNCDFDILLIFWQLGQGNSKHHRCFAELVSHFQFWLVWDILFLLLLVSDIWELAANECLILTPRNSHLSSPMQLHLT